MKNIKEWQVEERPREKMLSKGAEALTSAELVAILLRNGRGGESAVDLGRKVVEMTGGSVRDLMRLPVERLCSVAGIGKAKAASILAAAELGRRAFSENKAPAAPIRTSREAFNLVGPLLSGLDHEEYWALFLNSSGAVISRERLSSGGVSATVIDIRLTVKRAVEKLACGVIIFHNHPSGNPTPGKSDIRQTEALRDALQYLDIRLLDHIVVAGNKYFSFSDENPNFAGI